MAKPEPQSKPQRARLPPTRTPHARTRAATSAPAPTRFVKPVRPVYETQLQEAQLQEAQRRWFDREVATLQRLAHTERLMGNYVAAQRLEHELDAFIEASALAEAGTFAGQERG